MTSKGKAKWLLHLETMLEKIDVECFLNDVWPGEWKKMYGSNTEKAFLAIAESMTPAEFKKALDESGCRN